MQFQPLLTSDKLASRNLEQSGRRAMFSWWRRRKERQQQVLRDADNLVALFGERAYFEALARAQHEDEQRRDPRYWLAVRREIADRTGKEIGLDTATRYFSR